MAFLARILMKFGKKRIEKRENPAFLPIVVPVFGCKGHFAPQN